MDATSSPTPQGTEPHPQRNIWRWVALGCAALASITCLLVIGLTMLLRNPVTTITQSFNNTQACEDMYDQGRMDDAVAACTRAITAVPAYAPNYVTRGYIFYIRGDYPRALADFDQALIQDPNNGQAFINRGLVYERMGDIEATIQNYDTMLTRAIPEKSDLAYGYNNRGVAYRTRGDTEQATQDFLSAMQQDPSLPEPHENLKGLYLDRQDLDGLIQTYTTLLQQYPSSAEFVYQRGLIYRMKGQAKLALADFQTCLTLQPSELVRQHAEAQIREIEPLVR